MHSGAFRQLGGKTQVIASPWADLFRNRLTHTLEVSQIGRTLAKKWGLDESLVEAACLGHDLGHPPFGHAGERMLNSLMTDHGGFDANAQTIRVLRYLERKSSGRRGLNLTRATYLSLIKYPYRRDGVVPVEEAIPDGASLERLQEDRAEVIATRQYLYHEDLDLEVSAGLDFGSWLGDGRIEIPLGSNARLFGPPPRILICQLMDYSDDVAYAIHDFEDAVNAGFINQGSFARIQRDLEAAVRRDMGARATALENFDELFNGLFEEIATIIGKSAKDPGALRPETRKILGSLVDAVSIQAPANASEMTIDFELTISGRDRVLVSMLKNVGFELMIRDERIVRYLRKGTMMLERTFQELLDDPHVVDERSGQLLPRAVGDELRGAPEESRPRVIADFLASMSEASLTRFYQTVFDATGGSPLV